MKFILVSLIVIATSQVFAAGAMDYKCYGVNKITRAAVEFDVTFSDYDRGIGFSNQSVTFTKIGDETVQSPVSLQMYGAKKANNCKMSSEGELYMDPKSSDFKMTASTDKDQEGEVTTFKLSCSGLALDVAAVCNREF